MIGDERSRPTIALRWFGICLQHLCCPQVLACQSCECELPVPLFCNPFLVDARWIGTLPLGTLPLVTMPHLDGVIRNRDRMLQGEQRFCRTVSVCQFWKFPHARHQRRIPLPLHQEHFAGAAVSIAVIERVMNLTLFLRSWLGRAWQFSARCAQVDERTGQATRRPRRTYDRS